MTCKPCETRKRLGLRGPCPACARRAAKPSKRKPPAAPAAPPIAPARVRERGVELKLRARIAELEAEVLEHEQLDAEFKEVERKVAALERGNALLERRASDLEGKLKAIPAKAILDLAPSAPVVTSTDRRSEAVLREQLAKADRTVTELRAQLKKQRGELLALKGTKRDAAAAAPARARGTKQERSAHRLGRDPDAAEELDQVEPREDTSDIFDRRTGRASVDVAALE